MSKLQSILINYKKFQRDKDFCVPKNTTLLFITFLDMQNDTFFMPIVSYVRLVMHVNIKNVTIIIYFLHVFLLSLLRP